jgi:hypothetical protein
VLRKAGIVLLAVALGTGSSLAVAACGEDRGTVEFEGGSTTGVDTGGTTVETAPQTESTNP